MPIIIVLRAGNYDFSIRIGSLKDDFLKNRKISNSKRGIFCSPYSIAIHGKPESIYQLADHDGLGYPHVNSSRIWNFESLNGNKNVDLASFAHPLSIVMRTINSSHKWVGIAELLIS